MVLKYAHFLPAGLSSFAHGEVGIRDFSGFTLGYTDELWAGRIFNSDPTHCRVEALGVALTKTR